ncbi:MAG: sigma 54-interacting transcriptional regulator [Acidobacteriota bacterium]
MTHAGEGRERHLAVLRDLLSKDYLSRGAWREALTDLSRAVRTALDAQEAMVAVWREDRWEAIASRGERLLDEDIARFGSRSVIEEVRRLQEPVLTTGDEEIAIDSESIQRQDIEGVLAVPIFFWDVTKDRGERLFGGCLYAHRTSERSPFGPQDVDILVDIARIAQPTLNLLRHLQDLNVVLEASQKEVSELRLQSAREYRMGPDGARVPWSIFEPLSRMIENNKITLLILGPSGSGKSHLARTYHYACPRKDRPFVVLDCGSVTSAETLGAELFGYAPSSGYVNAPKNGSVGKARLAHEGTLFIDEIANLALELQPKLLRLIQEGRYSALGAGQEDVVDIQIVAATNVDLAARVAQGAFREDLYHRLNVVRVKLPPLAERVDEIPEITAQLVARVASEAGKQVRSLTPQALASLIAHDWSRSGNIRGLENLLRRSVWAAPVGLRELEESHIRWLTDDTIESPGPSAPTAAPALPGRRGGQSESLRAVVEAIRTHRNAAEAAIALGISYRQLYWQLQKAGLTVRDVLAGRDR